MGYKVTNVRGLGKYDIAWDGKGDKDQSALAAMEEYLGSEYYADLCEELRKHDAPTLGQLRFSLSFIGVQGYSVEALHKAIWPEANEQRKQDVE